MLLLNPFCDASFSAVAPPRTGSHWGMHDTPLDPLVG